MSSEWGQKVHSQAPGPHKHVLRVFHFSFMDSLLTNLEKHWGHSVKTVDYPSLSGTSLSALPKSHGSLWRE